MDNEIIRRLSVISAKEYAFLQGETAINRDLYMQEDPNVISSKKLLAAGKLITIRPNTRFVHLRSIPMIMWSWCTPAALVMSILEAKVQAAKAVNVRIQQLAQLFARLFGERQEAATVQVVMLDAIKELNYANAFGGVSAMLEFLIDIIVNWEVESYRSKVNLDEK